jgi:hypothetical protein
MLPSDFKQIPVLELHCVTTPQYVSARLEGWGIPQSTKEFISAQERVCPKFDMVWLNRSPFPVGRRGVISSLK